MLPLILLVITWVAGILFARKMNDTTKPARTEAETYAKYLELDALKAIRESAYQRWEKRRSYEWQLSISIWTAAVAFTGIILRKDHPFDHPRPVAAVVAAVGVLIIVFHTFYLLSILKHTLGDAEIQRWAENRIYRMAFDRSLDKDASGPGEYERKYEFYPPLSKGGGILQILITAVLVLAAFGAVFGAGYK